MDIDSTERFKLLIALIGILTLMGLLVITMLLVFWRRFNERQSRLGVRRAGETSPQADLWFESGQRLARRLEQGASTQVDDQDEDDDDEEINDDDTPGDAQDDDRRP